MPSVAAEPPKANRNTRWLIATAIGLIIWVALYALLVPFADWATSLLPIDRHSHTGEAIAFFLYDASKVLLLLTLVVFAMGVVRSFFSAERTRALLSGRREGIGNVLAASLGIVTPFCSCSAVPLFIGFVSAGVPLGVTSPSSSPRRGRIAFPPLAPFSWCPSICALLLGLPSESRSVRSLSNACSGYDGQCFEPECELLIPMRT